MSTPVPPPASTVPQTDPPTDQPTGQPADSPTDLPTDPSTGRKVGRATDGRDTRALQLRIDGLGFAEARRLGRRLSGTRQVKDRARRSLAIRELETAVVKAEAALARRRSGVPKLAFPPELPVSARVDDLAKAIAEHQVVIVAGETGSGKSTQLPKICLQLGRGVRGLIGHTQPRRIAARALAERIAEETGTEVGGAIGYSIRFGDHTGPDTMVKLMTDGILLAEINHDRLLAKYDTIIIDEAHERSLNIDFLIGYLTELLPRRPDLKVIITSATIDPQRFAQHFGDVPVVEVSGRTYPVEILYRPYGVEEDGDDDDPDAEIRHRPGRAGEAVDQTQAITAAVDELSAVGDGDILVFLSGEREITDTAEVLRGHLAGRPGLTEVLPLYGRLSAADQHRIFTAHSGRRIVLSTNVAETSLTVPGIRYVIDPGTARISRYSPRTKVQRLPIEKISQASAGQRAGRCGRVADGVCIRLYSESDFSSRPEFTDPEIIRTSLASVILQMAALELGDIATFPFLDPPDQRQITDGITVLDELGALARAEDGEWRLTATGRQVAALPIDPRLARMIVEADRRACLADVLVIAAALAIQDVREYPLDDRDRATAVHARFLDPTSDFLGYLNLWYYLQREAKARSGNAFRRMCRTEYLHYLRIREWQDLHAQLALVCRSLKIRVDTVDRALAPAPESGDQPGSRPESEPGNGPAKKALPGGESATQQGRSSLAVGGVDTTAVHLSLLAGLLSHIGLRSETAARGPRGNQPVNPYQGARGSNFAIWPGSALAKNQPTLVVAAELVETSRLWARVVARVSPDWVEDAGAELLRRKYSEPRWDARRASVVATEKVTLLGVTIVGARTVQYSRIDPVVSRELFIRHALVERDWSGRHSFLAHNDAAREAVADLEDRVRRRDIMLDDESLYRLYDERIPADVVSGRHFDSWWRKESRRSPQLLDFTPAMLTAAGADVDPEEFPTTYSAGPIDLPLDYVFDPTRPDDGVNVRIPLNVLHRVDPSAFEAQIPGLRRELVVALLRSLPKTLRRNFVPAPDYAARALELLPEEPESLTVALAGTLTRLSGIPVRVEDFDLSRVPDHLLMTFRVVDDAGKEVAVGKNLPALQDRLRPDTRRALAEAAGSGAARERTGLTEFPAEGVPRRFETEVGNQIVVGYPALIDEFRSTAADPATATVGVSIFTTAADQGRAMRAGNRRLLLRAAVAANAVPVAQIRNGLNRADQFVLATTPHGNVAGLVADATEAAVDALLDWAGGPAWTPDAFGRLRDRMLPQLFPAAMEIVLAALKVLRSAHTATMAIEAAAGAAGANRWAAQVTDLRQTLRRLVGPGFLTATGAGHLPDLLRWLEALTLRAERLRDNPERDAVRMAEIDELAAEIDAAVALLRPDRAADDDVRAVGRLLDEYRVAVFAQPMRTAIPVSAKRIRAVIAELR